MDYVHLKKNSTLPDNFLQKFCHSIWNCDTKAVLKKGSVSVGWVENPQHRTDSQ